ncbi:MAG: glycosyltransferase family 87 protein [Bacteroidota bacterium]
MRTYPFIDKIAKLVLQPRVLLGIYIAAAVIAAVQLVLLGSHEFTWPKPPYPDDIMNKPHLMKLFIGRQLTEYNNYLIFKHSFFHLLQGSNLYGVYPAEHWDFYKYSPTFALLMAPLAYLPDIVGLTIWNLANALAVFFAIRMLPLNIRTQCMLLLFVAMELLTSLQNTQSNGLMCGLMIAAYGCMQKDKPLWATLWLVLATYIKVYGAIGFCLFLFYPGKLRFIAYAALWTIVLGALPLMVTSWQMLVTQYTNWAALIKADASAAVGLSVAGWLKSWFGLTNIMSYITLTGVFLFFLPFLRFAHYRDEAFRILILASMLLWVVIFNHKAESPTFIIAVAGAGIWYFSRPKATWRAVLFWVVFIFTSLATTDIFPPFVKQHFIYPYTIKAVPCIIAWFVVLAELMTMRRGEAHPLLMRTPQLQQKAGV